MKELDAPVAASGRQAELVAGDVRVTVARQTRASGASSRSLTLSASAGEGAGPSPR